MSQGLCEEESGPSSEITCSEWAPLTVSEQSHLPWQKEASFPPGTLLRLRLEFSLQPGTIKVQQKACDLFKQAWTLFWIKNGPIYGFASKSCEMCGFVWLQLEMSLRHKKFRFWSGSRPTQSWGMFGLRHFVLVHLQFQHENQVGPATPCSSPNFCSFSNLTWWQQQQEGPHDLWRALKPIRHCLSLCKPKPWHLPSSYN